MGEEYTSRGKTLLRVTESFAVPAECAIPTP
jgi:hypothetical protein